MFITRRRIISIFAIVALSVVSYLHAQDYPTKPIKLVVPFPPGGPTDLIGRLLAQKLSQVLGQAVITENRPGAGGTIGADVVAKSPSDGYTLLYGSTSTLAISPTVYKKLGYDPVKAFAPVALVSKGQQILVANPQLPGNSLRDLVEYAKRNPDKVSYSSAGNGTPGHLATELLKEITGMPAVHAPYKGGAPALQAVLAGDTMFTVDVVPTSLQYVRAGRLKPLAILGKQRSNVLPDVPTVGQAGFKDISADFWSGVVAPAGTPTAVIAKLNHEIRKIVATSEFKELLEKVGAEPQNMSSLEFAQFINGELQKWASVAKAADVKLD
jgi:tripartite-type tricarboxylate transporter receptor subunit TctC